MVSICKSCRNQRTSNAVSKARAGLGTSSANVVAHAGVLAGGAVQVSHRPGAAGSRKSSRPGRIGAWALILIRAGQVLERGVAG